jgi:hypothetical protein
MELPPKSPEPKSACIPIVGPMKPIIALELGSTAAPEIFSFQRLFAGKGTKPFRLAPAPTLIPPQALACVLPFTVRFTPEELLAPGFGLLTVTAYEPDVAWLPLTVNCVALTKVVLSGTPAKDACAPFTKLLPVMVSVKLPPFIVEGEMLFRIGVGFSSVTVAVALAVESAVLVAATVTVLEFGNVCGATYCPAELMIPAPPFPPATPFTDQVTAVLLAPVTAAINCCGAPARTFAVGGVTATLTPAEGFFTGSGVVVLLVAAQPAVQTTPARHHS